MLSFYLNGQAIEPPENWQEFEIELSWEDNTPTASCKINSFDFVGVNAEFINGWIYNGLVGGIGIFEGPTFQIKGCDGIMIFDGILDLTNAGNKFDCDRCTVYIRENVRIDWLNDVADSFTFAYLASSQVTGSAHISSSDYVKIPYVISTLPNYTQMAMLGLSSFMIIKELRRLVIYEVPNIFQQIIVNAPGVTDPFVLAGYIVELLLLIAYILILFVLLAKLIQQLMDNFIQPDKYKYGMKVKKLFEKACAHLGLTFTSSIFNSQPFAELTIIPQKYVIEDPSKHRDLPFDEGFKGFLGGYYYNTAAYGYYDGTFGSLIREMNDVFNAKIKITAGTLSFEVFDHVYSAPSYTLPDVVGMPNNTNASELSSNYYVEFITDSEEINTYDKYDKTNAQCMFTPINVNTQKNVLLKNLDSHTFNYAMAKRKNDFTLMEFEFSVVMNLMITFWSAVYDVFEAAVSGINTILNLFGTSISNPISVPPPFVWLDRKGFMLLETDYIGVQKLLLTEKTGKIPINNITYVNAEYLLRNFHNHSFIQDTAIDPSTGTQFNNQFWIYTDKEIPFCCTDYLTMLNNNWIKTFSGERAKAMKLIWSPEKQEARVDYNVKKQYTKNIKQTYVVEGVTL